MSLKVNNFNNYSIIAIKSMLPDINDGKISADNIYLYYVLFLLN